MTWACVTIFAGLDAGKRVTRGLDRLGFIYYNPLTIETWVTRGREVQRQVQLFPGYLFCQIESKWRELTSLAGVVGVLKDSGGPLRVNDRMIEQLKADEVEGVYLPQAPPPRFKKGEPVLLCDGAYVDKVVVYDGMCGLERSAVLLSMLGKQVRCVVANEALLEIHSQ